MPRSSALVPVMLTIAAMLSPLACTSSAPAPSDPSVRATPEDPAPTTSPRPEDFPGTAQGAEALLRALMKPGGDLALTRALQPRPEDYARVFTAPLADKVREDHAPTWARVTAIGPLEGQTELRLFVATSDELRAKTAVFPSFEPLLESLQPGFTWVRFQFVKPGESAGRQLDGLVYVGDHWALFPEAWRLATPGRPSAESCIKFADHFGELMARGQEGEAAKITRDVAASMRPELIKDCGEMGTLNEIECALAAKSMEELEKCSNVQ